MKLLKEHQKMQLRRNKVAAASQAVNIINLLGGRANIVDVDACMTRLRVTVRMQIVLV